jgi:hypothetical protein
VDRSRFLLIATVAADDVAGDELERLLRSLAEQDVEIALHLVIRGRHLDATAVKRCWQGELVLHGAAAGTSLSRARNIALRHLQAAGELDRADAVAYPDDDCWYPPRLLARAGRLLADWDIVMGSYSARPPRVDRDRFPDAPAELDWRRAYERTASVTQFYRAGAVRDVGLFDERFGIGARYPSAEDADYLVRAIHRGRRCFYQPSLVVGHPQREGRYQGHYLGGTALLAKHALRVRAARRLLMRRLVAGASRTATGALPPTTYAQSLRAVVATFGRAG